MARTPGHGAHTHGPAHPRLRLAEHPPERPPAEEADLVDAMDAIARYLSTVVRLSKIATLLLAWLVVGLGLRLLGVG